MTITLPPCQPSMYDSLFKEIITAGWNVSSDGHVESPQGFFAITEIPEHKGELKQMQEEFADVEVDNWPQPGWFFSMENSDGTIYVYRVDKESAEVLFEEYSAAYAKWDAE